MQADEAGNHRVTGKVEDAGAIRDLDLGVGAYRGDPPVPDQDGLPAGRGAAGAVHHLHAGQRHRRLADLDELPHGGGERVRRLRPARKRGDEKRKRSDQEPHR